MKSNYKLIDELVERVDERNTDGEINNLVGLSIEKCFINSVANTIGTDLKKYKVIRKNYFAVSLMQVSRDSKIPIARFTENNAIMSPAYSIFKVRDDSEILPEYLDMWFKRMEFDREATFIAVGGVRGSMPFEEFSRMKVLVPDIDTQKSVVRNYNCISERISLLKKINDNLAEQLSTEFHILFDSDKSSECTIGDYGEIISGATPSTANEDFFCDEGIVWLTPKDLTSTGLKFINKGEIDITSEGYASCSTRLLPPGTVLLTSRAPVGTVAIADKELCTNQGFKSIVPNERFGTEFVFQFLKENKSLLDSHASGTTFMEISGNVLKSVPAFVPSQNNIEKYKKFCAPLYTEQRNNEREIQIMRSMLETLLCQLSSR